MLMGGFRVKHIPVMAAGVLLASSCLVPSTAFAVSMDQLQAAYVKALSGYEKALNAKDENAAEIEEAERKIEEAEQQRKSAEGELGETASALYKDTRSNNVLVDIILGSRSFQDAVIRYDLYEKVENRCVERIEELAARRDELTAQKEELEAQKNDIGKRVEKARKEAELAEKALIRASHVDGDRYQQVQGNGSNCGATSFTVGLNILLHEKRYTDNVAVWEGAGFNGDSTNNLARRAKMWLIANKLDDKVGIEEVRGDVHETSELKELLNDGNVVIISSGGGSVWQYADGSTAAPSAFPDGHWIVFYRCSKGVFYCNDSAVETKKGAGCAYTEKEMQQWLDGRANHFATIMYLK